jgi:tripartite-type tricarboxylate transporter receptor subunit TctC
MMSGETLTLAGGASGLRTSGFGRDQAHLPGVQQTRQTMPTVVVTRFGRSCEALPVNPLSSLVKQVFTGDQSMKYKSILLAMVLGSTLAAPVAVLAQAYPTKPIKAVVPFAAGSATDQIGRAFAAKMSETLGQTIVVDNKPGVNGMLGADAVAKSAPDGYTLMMGTNSTNAALKSLMKKLPYDQDTAFAPVAYLGSVPLIIAVNNNVPANNLRELVDLAKAKPGEVTFASASTSQLVSASMLTSMAGVQMNNIPYKSGPAAMTDLIGGQVMMFSADFAVTLPQVKAGKIRGLAVTSAKRSAVISELPTVNEALGLKDYELIAYFAIYAPAGTPPDVIAKLNQAANAAANSKDLQDKFASIGFAVEPGTPEDLARRGARETAKWAKAIQDAKIEPQ